VCLKIRLGKPRLGKTHRLNFFYLSQRDIINKAKKKEREKKLET
jgi:hypothetical protein